MLTYPRDKTQHQQAPQARYSSCPHACSWSPSVSRWHNLAHSSLWCVAKFVELYLHCNPGKKTLASSSSLSQPKETEDNAFSLQRLQFLSLHSCCGWQLIVFWLIWNSWCISHKAQMCPMQYLWTYSMLSVEFQSPSIVKLE